MRVAARLAVFVTAAAAAFGLAFAAGAVTAPIAATPPDGAHGQSHESEAAGQAATAAGDGALPGLSVSDQGYSLRVADATLPEGGRVLLSFRIDGPDGAPVLQYRPTHEKEMHLIVVRRDLSLFQHLHPARDAGGTWTTPVNLAAAGTYRVFADFAPAALPDRTLTLGTDTFVPGVFEPADLPAPSGTASIDGYELALAGAPRAGVESELEFTVTRAGTPVADLEPYLAAFGHLVSLRAGDLAYLHTHPVDELGPTGRGGPTIRFATTFPIAGSYRLFLNFAHAGDVRTAAFTVDVPSPQGAAVTAGPMPNNTAGPAATPASAPAHADH